MNRYKKTVLVAMGLAVVASWFAHEDGAAEEQRQVDMQCEMFDLYKKTNGELGWPNYEGVECE